MEIILLKDVEKLGRSNDLMTVKPGFARNFLIPQKLAVTANAANRKLRDERIAQDEARREAMLSDFRKMAEKLKDSVIRIGAKSGTSGKIFGSVTAVQLSAALKDQLSMDIDRRDITLTSEVKELGSYTATANLHKEVQPIINFEVVAE